MSLGRPKVVIIFVILFAIVGFFWALYASGAHIDSLGTKMIKVDISSPKSVGESRSYKITVK